MTRRIPDRGELTITCERDCRHSGKIFRVPPAPKVLGRGERERASDPRLSSQLAPYLPRVNAVNHRLKNSLERHNGAVTREHALGQKHRDQAARWLYGQFAHYQHYSMVDALMNLDISRNLARLGGPGPLVPWNVAEDRAMENNYGVIHRKDKRKKEEQRENAAVSTGWRPSSTTDKDEKRLKELEKERALRVGAISP